MVALVIFICRITLSLAHLFTWLVRGGFCPHLDFSRIRCHAASDDTAFLGGDDYEVSRGHRGFEDGEQGYVVHALLLEGKKEKTYWLSVTENWRILYHPCTSWLRLDCFQDV